MPGYGPVVGSREHSDEPAGSIKSREFLVRSEVPSTVTIRLQSTGYDAM
jgi:hypothetical protein